MNSGARAGAESRSGTERAVHGASLPYCPARATADHRRQRDLGGELVRRASAGGSANGRRDASRHRRRPALDVRDAATVERLVGEIRPAAIVATAYLQSGPDMADVNVAGSANVARAAAAAGAPACGLSTDFVFDGEKDGAYREDERRRAPVTSYGESKLAAEQAVAAERRRPARAHVAAAPPPRPGGLESSSRRHRRYRRCRILHGRAAVPDRGWDARRRAARATRIATCAGRCTSPGRDRRARYQFAELVAGAAQGSTAGGCDPLCSADLPVRRPRNCALDCSRAAAVLATPAARPVRGAQSGRPADLTLEARCATTAR